MSEPDLAQEEPVQTEVEDSSAINPELNETAPQTDPETGNSIDAELAETVDQPAVNEIENGAIETVSVPADGDKTVTESATNLTKPDENNDQSEAGSISEQLLNSSLEGINADAFGIFDDDANELDLNEADTLFSMPTEATDSKQTAENQFASIVHCDDNLHPLPASTRVMNSPKLKRSLDFVSTEYTTEDDWFSLQMGLTMSRSGSEDDIKVERLFVSKEDGSKEIPRPDTPTKARASIDLEKMPLVEETAAVEAEVSEEKPEEAEAEPEPVQELEPFNREELIEKICANLELKEKLQARNILLQNKLSEHFKKKRNDDIRENEKSAVDQEQRYNSCMNALNDLRNEGEIINNNNKKTIADYQLKLAERVKETEEKVEQFWKYKLSVAAAAENSRTGKPLPPKVLEQLEATERKKDGEIVAVRLENIKLRNKLRRHEQLLRQKEELADGLHLIDFEQLKIENQTYNEKIEERNEELLKLRKKITNVVQVLTHVKEKLQFVQTETTDLKKQLESLDYDVSRERDMLPQIKSAREKLKANNVLLRQQNGLLGNEKLIVDYGRNIDAAKDLKEKIASLQQTYSALISESILIRRKIQKSQLIAQLRAESSKIEMS